MIWFALALFVISFLVTAFLSPKPNTENARRGSLDGVQAPHSSEGDPIPLILGRVKLNGPNSLWYGDFTWHTMKQTVKTGMFSSKKVIVGYQYFLGIAMGLCVGPGVRLLSIFFDKDAVWTGDLGGVSTGTIDKPNMWGGDAQGGGWSGPFSFYDGSFTQPINAYLDGVCPNGTPAYVGVAYIVFERNYIGTSAQLRPITFELSRYTNGLGLSSDVNIIGEDLNPCECLYQVLTSDWGGLDIDPSDVDSSSLVACANTLADEGLGMSLVLSTASDGKTVTEEILRQINGVLYQDPATGKITLQLIREDYVIEDLPVFDESSIATVRTYTRTSWDDTINQMRVNYADRSNKYATGTAIAQDMANINAQGRMRSSTLSMPLCYTADVANTIATRELNQLAAPLIKATLELNRSASTLRPGDAFVWKWADFRLTQIIMRVQRFNLGELLKGKIVIDAVQDQFGIKNTIFAPPIPPIVSITDRSAVNATDVLFTEAPYWLMQRQTDIAVIPPSAADRTFMLTMARQPNQYQLGFTATETQGAYTSVEVDHYPFTDSAKLLTTISYLDGYANGLLTSINVNLPLEDSSILTAYSSADVRIGHNLLFLGDELMAFETVTDNHDGTWTLGNVHRALLDTQMESHAIGDVLFFVSVDYLGQSEWVGDTAISAKIQSFTDRDETVLSAAPTFAVTPNRRYERPLPPDYITLGGSRAPATVSVSTAQTVAWRARTRLRTDIAFENDAADTEEAGTTYTMRYYFDGVLQPSYTQTGISGSTTTISFVDPYVGVARLEIAAVVGGLESYMTNFIEFTIHTGGIALLSGDAQSGTDGVKLSGDMTDGDDLEELTGSY